MLRSVAFSRGKLLLSALDISASPADYPRFSDKAGSLGRRFYRVRKLP